MASTDMTRDPRDEWPADAAPGTFDIHVGGCEGYPAADARILFVCPRGRRCSVLLGAQWNGDLEKPTLSPSLNCLSEKDGKPRGGCGWHGHVVAGTMTS